MFANLTLLKIISILSLIGTVLMKYSSPCFGWPSVGINKLVSICQTPGWISFDMLIDLNDGILTGFPFSHGSPEFCFSTDKVTDNVALQGKFSSFFFFLLAALKGFFSLAPKSASFHEFLPGGTSPPSPQPPSKGPKHISQLFRITVTCKLCVQSRSFQPRTMSVLHHLLLHLLLLLLL